MLFSYNACIEKYGNDYQIKKALSAGQIYKIEQGIYSDTPTVSEIERVSFKYPQTVFTMDSAFYYHGLSDVIPEKLHLATSKDAYKIGDDRVKQYFHRKDTFPVGVTSIPYRNSEIRVYDKERMLIELIRNKKSLPFDYYKEVIESYRKAVHTMDIEKMQQYICVFPNQRHILEAVELEVM